MEAQGPSIIVEFAVLARERRAPVLRLARLRYSTSSLRSLISMASTNNEESPQSTSSANPTAPSAPECARKPARVTAGGLLGPLAATTGLLGVLLVWARTYEQSCHSLVSPALVCIAVFWGLLQYRLERRRFAIGYYLDGGSPWRRRLRRSWLPVVISMVAALPLTVFLAAFAALAGAADWLFLAGASLLAPLLFNGVRIWPGRHFRGAAGGGILAAPAGVLTSRVAGRVLLALVVVAFVYFNHSMIPAPANINPGFPELTVEAFAAPVRSDCAIVEKGLRTAASFDRAGWLFVTVADSEQWVPEEIMAMIWAAFFLNAALAMAGFVRGLEGTILVAACVVPGVRSCGARNPGAETNLNGRAAGIRRATLLLVPLTVLTVIAHHALQQRAVERWSTELGSLDLAEIRLAIEVSVDNAFAPAYAAIPEFVNQHTSLAAAWAQLSSFFSEDKLPVADLHRRVSGAREAAVKHVYRELRKNDLDRLARLFNRDMVALPPWLRTAYEWVLEPVVGKARSRLAEDFDKEARGALSELQRTLNTADIATRAWHRLGWFVASTVGSDRYKEHLRQWVAAVLDEEKALAKDELLAVATARFKRPNEDAP